MTHKSPYLREVLSYGACGLYAWSLTVVPVAFARQGLSASKLLSFLGLGLLLVAVALSMLRPGLRTKARTVALFGLLLPSLAVWLLTPHALSPLRLEPSRAALGALAWGAFAFAIAGPSRRRSPEGVPSPLAPRHPPRTAEKAILLSGVALAVSLQGLGWGVVPDARALLVRAMLGVAGIAIVSASARVSVSHYGRGREPPGARLRKALPVLLVLLMTLLLGGTVLRLL